MHCRVIWNIVAILKFSDVRDECSVFTAKKKDGLIVLALFNLCRKIKKVLNQIWQSSG